MKALSIRSPWWWFILHGGKNIENRDWPTRFRGTIYLHASRFFNIEEISDDTRTGVDIVKHSGWQGKGEFTFRQMRDCGGHIVGVVDIVDCVSHSDSPWFFGRYGFVLENPIAFETPIPCKGALGFFEVSDLPYEPKMVEPLPPLKAQR